MKDNVPDDPPQEGIQEEQYEIHQIHDRQSESDLVCAKCITEVLVVTRANLHAHNGINGFPEGEGQEPIRFGELATKYEEPEKNGRQPLFRRRGRIDGWESLADKVFPRLSGDTISEHPTGRHDGEDEGCNYGDEELDNSEDEGCCLVPSTTFRYRDVKGWAGCEGECDQEEEQVPGEVGHIAPGGRDIGKFGDGDGDHDHSGYCTTKSGCRPPHRRGVSTIVDLEGVVGGVGPVDSDVNDPYTIEVDQPMSERPFLVVRLEEGSTPCNPVKLHEPLGWGKIRKTGLLGNRVSVCLVRLRRRAYIVIQHNPCDTIRVPKQLVDIVVADNVCMVLLPANKPPFNNFICLITDEAVERFDDGA